MLSSQRFRSVSAIYKDTDAGHGDRAEPSRGTEPRRTAAAATGRDAERAVVAVHDSYRVIPSPLAAPPSAQLRSRRITRAADQERASATATGGRRSGSEARQSAGPLITQAAVKQGPAAAEIGSPVAATDASADGAEAMNGYEVPAAGSRPRARKRRAVPEPLAQAVIPMLVAEDRSTEALDAPLTAGEGEPERLQDDAHAPERAHERADGGADSSSSEQDDEVSADLGADGRGGGSDDADDSDAFLETLAAKMLEAASAEDSIEETADSGSEGAERRQGSASEQVDVDSEDDLGEPHLHVGGSFRTHSGT